MSSRRIQVLSPACVAPLLLVMALSTTAPCARAQTIQNGDVVVPGNVTVDGFGGVNGVFFRVRGGVVTPLFQSAQYANPSDLIVDPQGRLVFIASPQSNNSGDVALFRLLPSTGQLERLFIFRAYVGPADTLPERTSGIAGYAGRAQGLHLERSYSVTIDDHQNSGWPQLRTSDSYAFALTTSTGAQSSPRVWRYHQDSGSTDEGISLGLLRQDATVAMTGKGSDVYYGGFGTIGHAKTDLELNVHLTLGGTTLSAYLRVSPENKLVFISPILDNTLIPNVTSTCGTITDDNVPMEGGGFHPLDLNAIGLIDGALYASTGSVSTGAPYMFSLAGRAPFLNPYICQYYTCVTHNGPFPYYLPDGTATSSAWNSPDGAGVLINNGNVLKLGIDGSAAMVASSSQGRFTGRPVRYAAGGSPLPPAAATGPASAVPDTSAMMLVLRADSLVNVLLADPRGRRLGFDSTGALVNDFGDGGSVMALGSGWPHLVTLANPASGNFVVRVAGTATGAYGVRAYLAHVDSGGVAADLAGNTQAGIVQGRTLQVSRPRGLTWYGGILGVAPPAVGIRGPAFTRIWPVPSQGSVDLEFAVPEGGGRARISIFDLSGRRIATLLDGPSPGGARTLRWSGAAAGGRPVTPGIYLARLEWGGSSVSRRLIIAR